MKKIVFLVLLSAGLFASQNSDYVSVGGGVTKLSVDTAAGKDSSNGTSFTFLLGHKYGDYGRFNASGTYVSASSNIDNSSIFSLAYDFVFPVVDDMFSLYVGPVAGYTSYTEGTLDLSGLHYGLEMGMTFNITENFELEAGGRYLKEEGSSTTTELEDAQMLYFQINYYFDSDKYFKYE